MSEAETVNDDAFLRVIRNSQDLTAERKADYARLWSEGGREKVAAIVARDART